MALRQDLFSFIRFTLYYGEMFPLHLEQRFPTFLRVLGVSLELTYELFLYFVAFHLAILYMFTVYFNYLKGDLQLLVNSLMQTNIFVWTIGMKLYFRRIRPKLLEELVDFINFKHKTRSEIGFSHVTMEGSLALSNRNIKVFVCCSFVGCIFWVIVPFAYNDRRLPLACWYPFDYKQPFIYETIYFLQFVGQIQVAAAFCGSSGFHMVLAVLISGQYDILFCSLKNILATVAIKRKATKSELRDLYNKQLFTKPELNEFYCCKERTIKFDDLIQSITRKKRQNFRLNFHNPFKKSFDHKTTSRAQSKNFDFQFHDALKKCVDHHRYIVECLNKMESFYSPIWFLKTAQIIFAMCLMTFESYKSTSANSSPMQVITVVQYLFLVTWELLIICYFGEIVYVNSQRCGEALMRSPWYIHMREMKYDFLLFMLNSKRPFKLTAGKIYLINTDLLIAIIKMAFSFLTLLQKMDERNN